MVLTNKGSSRSSTVLYSRPTIQKIIYFLLDFLVVKILVGPAQGRKRGTHLLLEALLLEARRVQAASFLKRKLPRLQSH